MKGMDSWSHCVRCHLLEVKEIRNEKQWLANEKVIVSTLQTATQEKNIAPNQRHLDYRAGEDLEEEAKEKRQGIRDQ